MATGAGCRSSRREWWQAAAAVGRSGVVAPVSPPVAARIAARVWRHGASVATLFAVSAARYPDRVAVKDDEGEVTYAELYERSVSLAHHLATRRAVMPASVAVLCRNHRGFVVAVAAAGQTGAEIISINTELPQTQLSAVLARHAPDVLIYDGEYCDAVQASSYIGYGICVDPPSGYVGATLQSVDTTGPSRPTRVWKTGKFTLLTSGTTGLAKGVPRAIKPWGIVQLAATGCARIGLRSDDVVLIGPPLFHGFGLVALLGAVTVGATIICHRRFEPAVIADGLVEHRVTVLYAVPAMLQRLLGTPEIERATRGHSLRIAVTGAAPITSTTVKRFQALFGPVLVNGYGSTEAGLVSLAAAEHLLEAPATVGTAALGVTIRITDDSGNELPAGQSGRILVRGPLEYVGYTPDPNSPTASKLIIDGHVDTGDVGHLDDRGRLFVAGRSDDMIVSGGENVFPAEVEDVLSAHPAVTDTVVVGVDNDEFGQVLHAFVVLDGDTSISGGELKDHVRQHLERYKVPKRFTVIEEIPRNPSGKVMRTRLDAAAGGHDEGSGA